MEIDNIYDDIDINFIKQDIELLSTKNYIETLYRIQNFIGRWSNLMF